MILDFGSQFTQLIAKRIRELNVYCEIYPYNNFPVPDDCVKGVILSGSPFSLSDRDAPVPDLDTIRGHLPLLGIAYGARMLAKILGGTVLAVSEKKAEKQKLVFVDNSDPLFRNISPGTQVWMSGDESIERLPEFCRTVGSTDDIEHVAFHACGEHTWGLQFHPEVYYTADGKKIFENFVVGICGCSRDWTPASFVDTTVALLRKQLGNDKVVLGLSGGVDSSVTAMLLNRAIGRNLHCIFVDHGLLRHNEFKSVLQSYQGMGLNVTGVDASERFISALKGITDPEKKRKTIGNLFIDVFDQEAHRIEDVKWLAQGTIYPDVVESVSVNGASGTIKSHHNVGGLPDFMRLKVVEPLRLLFKDEVRRTGHVLGMPDYILHRHPFPGPGLAIRIIGEVNHESLRMAREADDIFISSLREHNLYDSVWQAAVILLPIQSVGVKAQKRTYENTVALRAVNSTDGMTAEWSSLPYEFLAGVSDKIINRVRGINRVVYDISSKPPATIEWE